MKRALLGLALSIFAVAGTGCPSTLTSALSSKCTKAVDNVMAKCGTCFGTSTSSTSSRDSASCRQDLMNMCGTGSSSSSSGSSSPAAFLDCVGNATSCDVIKLCN